LLCLPEDDIVPFEGFDKVFQALTNYVIDRAVVPVENSLAGSLHGVYDLVLRYRVHIVGEISIQIRHNLAALPGVEKAEIERVASHPQALMQCDSYLRRMNVAREEVFDTAAAAKSVGELEPPSVAAICSRRAAELYGLNILDQDIQDQEDNITRFWVISRDPLLMDEGSGDSAAFKTSIVFSLAEGPGQLFKALSVFSLRDIDMTKIESRPMRTNPFIQAPSSDPGLGEPRRGEDRGLFYIDIVGTLADEGVNNALRHLKEFAPFLRVLGSYPDMSPRGGAADA